MIRRWAILLMLGCGVVAGALAAVPTASPTSVPIRHGVGIGPVRLGMTGEQVRRILGAPRAVIERRVIRGQPYTELEYDFSAWNIGFLGRKGQRRVVLVGTGLARHKSPEGVGVGTREGVFWRRVRGEGFRRRRCEGPDPGGSLNSRFHWVRPGRGTETVYFPGGPFNQQEVTGVEVRAMPTVGCAF
jgi:hypothetical protein